MQLHCLFYLGTFVSKNVNKFGDKVAIALVTFYWDRLQVSFPIGENSTLEIFQSVNSRTVILAQFDHVFTLLRKYGISEKANTQFHQWEFNIIFTLFLWKKINVSLWHKKVFFPEMHWQYVNPFEILTAALSSIYWILTAPFLY